MIDDDALLIYILPAESTLSTGLPPTAIEVFCALQVLMQSESLHPLAP